MEDSRPSEMFQVRKHSGFWGRGGVVGWRMKNVTVVMTNLDLLDCLWVGWLMKICIKLLLILGRACLQVCRTDCGPKALLVSFFVRFQEGLLNPLRRKLHLISLEDLLV